MADSGAPRVSIVIPSHNRHRRLLAALEAIARQDFALDTVEVVIVADGCVDDTVAAVKQHQAPFAVRLFESPGLGPTMARNLGAEQARAPLLLFLDDDIEPLATWLSAHVTAHIRYPGSVVIGSYPPVPAAQSEFRDGVRHWWMRHFDELERPGHRFTWQDILTGNISLSHNLWNAIGGLDPAFAYAREDGELGVRLIAAGIPIVHAPDAFGWHHEYETLTIGGAFRRKREEGRSDVRLGIKHPHIRATLPIAQYYSTPGMRGRVDRTIFRSAAIGESIAKLTEWLAHRLSRRQTGGLFRRFMDAAGRTAYLRGAAEELVTLDRWRAFTSDGCQQQRKSLLLDLAQGLAASERMLDARRPDEARLIFGVLDIGWLSFAPGVEPWAGRHLKPFLIGPAAGGLIYALQQQGTLMGEGAPSARATVPEINAWSYLGVKGYLRSINEAMAQWSRIDTAGRA